MVIKGRNACAFGLFWYIVFSALPSTSGNMYYTLEKGKEWCKGRVATNRYWGWCLSLFEYNAVHLYCQTMLIMFTSVWQLECAFLFQQYPVDSFCPCGFFFCAKNLNIFRSKPRPLSLPPVRSPFSSKKKKSVRSSVNIESRSLPAPPKPPHTKPPPERKISYDKSLNPFSEDFEEFADSDSESVDNRVNESLCESANASTSSRESLDASGFASLADSMDSGLDEAARVVVVEPSECSGSTAAASPPSPDTPDTVIDTKLEEPGTAQPTPPQQEAQNQQLVL